MKRAWIGTALLAASWLLGLSYYHQADWWSYVLWAGMVLVGAALMGGVADRTVGPGVAVAAAVLLVPAAVLMPWPDKAAFVLTAAGLAFQALPVRRRWTGRVGSAAAVAGVVLAVQAVAIQAYESFTARWQDLPEPLVRLLAWLASAAGFDATAHGRDVALFSMRRMHSLAATWSLLADPVTMCFLAGGIVLICLRRWGSRPTGRWGWLGGLAPVAALVAVVVAWLPMRALLLMALYMHRALRTGYDDPLDLMNQFWSPWVHLLLLAGPVLLAWRFVRPTAKADDSPSPVPAPEPACPGWQPVATAVAAVVAVAAITASVVWDPVGTRKPGRILVDERRSNMDWPTKTFDTVRTNKPYDTTWYGHGAAYNYACLYDYCSRFYTLSRLEKAKQPITDDVLRDYDVLFLKVPSGGYTGTEIAAIRRFVENGGGLLLLGEHTSVYGSGVYLNQIARTFGFEFRYDCAFGIDSVFDQRFTPPLAPHPILQHMPPMDFATSCTIDPDGGSGRAVIQSTGLKSLGANYFASNYYPRAENQPQMRYGALVQLWATRHEAGRVVAFTDSTIFSNFAVFEPGKKELMMGMLEWLNHSNQGFDPRPPLAILGVLLLAGAMGLARPLRRHWPLVVAGGALGWAAAVVIAPAIGQGAMPPLKPTLPMITVATDRTVSEAKLPKNGFIGGKDDVFGIFERHILRLGYFTKRAAGENAFDANMVVVIHPTKDDQPQIEQFRDRLVEYVEGGGKVLLLDSPENVGSVSPVLLYPFNLKIRPVRGLRGPLTDTDGLPAIPIESACVVSGGQTVAKVAGRPVAAVARKGTGEIWVIGFGSRFADANMGVVGDVIPGPELRKLYEFQYALLRRIVRGSSPPPPAGPPAATTRAAPAGG